MIHPRRFYLHHTPVPVGGWRGGEWGRSSRIYLILYSSPSCGWKEKFGSVGLHTMPSCFPIKQHLVLAKEVVAMACAPPPLSLSLSLSLPTCFRLLTLRNGSAYKNIIINGKGIILMASVFVCAIKCDWCSWLDKRQVFVFVGASWKKAMRKNYRTVSSCLRWSFDRWYKRTLIRYKQRNSKGGNKSAFECPHWSYIFIYAQDRFFIPNTYATPDTWVG